MHPQTFLKTFWRLELRPQVFVAMSFAPEYQIRYDKVITPAITSLRVDGQSLKPFRVDISKNGDSILTEINEGIAHSQLVLADVSSIGKDSKTGRPYRNANVLYEVGLALACRHPSEVLLVRDDHDQFLFDVSTVPHKTIDFTELEMATKMIAEELEGRLREQKYHQDARVTRAIASLSSEEVLLLKQTKEYGAKMAWGKKPDAIANWFGDATQRLLDKDIIRLVGEFDEEKPAFEFTPLGCVILNYVNQDLRRISLGTPKEASTNIFIQKELSVTIYSSALESLPVQHVSRLDTVSGVGGFVDALTVEIRTGPPSSNLQSPTGILLATIFGTFDNELNFTGSTTADNSGTAGHFIIKNQNGEVLRVGRIGTLKDKTAEIQIENPVVVAGGILTVGIEKK